MDAAEVMEVCRLCPRVCPDNAKLISVFDEQFLGKNNMKEAIFVTTGIEVQESDEISVKICDRCCKITLQMFKFRQDAILQDKLLRERRNQLMKDQEIRLTSLKNRKKLCKSTKTTDSYFCKPVNKVQKRKRSSACDSGVKAKLSRQSNTGCSNNISEGPVTPLRVTIPLVKHTTPVVDQPEDAGDSVTTNKSTATSSRSNTEAYQHVNLECFGFTKLKSRIQLVCYLCGSVHNNASGLKRHTVKHMVCQFCKRKFKSLENKNHHVNNICEIRKIINSSSAEVHLNKIDLDLEIRKKYMEAFTTFAPIPGLVKSEEVAVRAVSPRQTMHQDTFIVLSDDDDDNTNPLAGTSTAIMSSVNNTISYPNPEPTLFNSSIVEPDIKLKTYDIISDFFGNNNEKEVIKGLLRRCIALKITREKMIQTDLPTSNDIKIKSNTSCEFKNLKDYMVLFKVPIHLVKGPFNAAYKFDNPPKSANKLGAWHSLPIVDVKKIFPNPQTVVANSKPVASSSAPIQEHVSRKNNNPQPNTSQSNNVHDLNSPTPIMQPYFDRAPNAEVPRKSPPIPKNYLTENSCSSSKSMLAANTPVSQSLNDHIGLKDVVLNNSTNNTTSQLKPNTMLGEILDRTHNCASLNISEGIAYNIKNCIPHPRVSTNQVFMNNTTIPTNSTNHVQNNVVPMDSTTSNTASINQQKNVIYPPLATSNTQTNDYTVPLTVTNTQKNLNPPSSRMLNAKTNAHLLLIPNKQMNVNPTVLTTQNNTQKNVSFFSTTQNTAKKVYPPASAKQNTQRNVNSPALAMQNAKMNINSPTLATQNTQRNVPASVPHRNAVLMSNTQRNSVKPAIRVKDIWKLL